METLGAPLLLVGARFRLADSLLVGTWKSLRKSEGDEARGNLEIIAQERSNRPANMLTLDGDHPPGSPSKVGIWTTLTAQLICQLWMATPQESIAQE